MVCLARTGIAFLHLPGPEILVHGCYVISHSYKLLCDQAIHAKCTEVPQAQESGSHSTSVFSRKCTKEDSQIFARAVLQFQLRSGPG
jgi:hypothetical protein